MDDTEQLLREWFTWWLETEGLPVNLPRSLHIRTAITLTERDMGAEGSLPSELTSGEAEKTLGSDPGSLFG